MEKRERKPGYFARLKRRRQLKQSQSEKGVAQQNPSDSPIISCPEAPAQKPGDNVGDDTHLPQRPDERDSSNSQSKREKRKPPGTVEYTVEPQDTLNIVALKFNITPNQLVQINKLFSQSIIPGQKLFVPDVGQSEPDSKGSCDPASTNGQPEKGSHDGGGRPARMLRREETPPSEDESPTTVKFIKMSCKYFTDGMGVVGGVMIVTPNNIMFDPHKSDPLVMEHGCEEYGLICPMQEVLSVALYDDVSRMKLKDSLPSDPPQDLCPLYRPGEWEELPSQLHANPFSRYQALDAGRTIVLDDIDSALSETDEGFTELVLPANGSVDGLESTSQSHTGSPSSLDQQGALSHSQTLTQHSSVEDGDSLAVPSEGGGAARLEQTPSAGPDPPDTPLRAARSFTNGVAAGSTSDQSRKLSLSEAKVASGKRGPRDVVLAGRPVEVPVGDEGMSEEERRRRSYEAEVKSWLMERMQAPIQNMLLSSEEKSKTPPMFLCFKLGRPMKKSFSLGRTSSPAHACRDTQPEYWFAVPQERVEHLYAFLVQCSPDVYGREVHEQGFVLVEKDELNMIDNFFSDPVPRNWEIITINEAKRRQSFSCEGEEPVDLLPVLSDPSALLQDTHIEKLACRLPARVQGYPWQRAYSTVEHGTSLKTLYRNLATLDCPVLLVIRDTDSRVFGAFSTHPFRLSEHCYGTGETFLYSFCPEIKVYRWTGENSYFVKGNTDSLQMGGGGGQLGLWLDADLYHGTSSPCATFNNTPLSTQKDFTVHSLEVWAFE
ncbi:nuclear receptor coactivator 7 isoform X2 [Hypomesus transpacificus]|uniref:nuclear receptor coactivator 7 isoform X2 n=1 Tax=Hypomesus transpacificus TaxID=137520 RepID=UPI001F080AE8|nr:nuclear receptor coactivator 7 isoform X2 [Hypomesus transpacificus]